MNWAMREKHHSPGQARGQNADKRLREMAKARRVERAFVGAVRKQAILADGEPLRWPTGEWRGVRQPACPSARGSRTGMISASPSASRTATIAIPAFWLPVSSVAQPTSAVAKGPVARPASA